MFCIAQSRSSGGLPRRVQTRLVAPPVRVQLHPFRSMSDHIRSISVRLGPFRVLQRSKSVPFRSDSGPNSTHVGPCWCMRGPSSVPLRSVSINFGPIQSMLGRCGPCAPNENRGPARGPLGAMCKAASRAESPTRKQAGERDAHAVRILDPRAFQSPCDISTASAAPLRNRPFLVVSRYVQPVRSACGCPDNQPVGSPRCGVAFDQSLSLQCTLETWMWEATHTPTQGESRVNHRTTIQADRRDICKQTPQSASK